MRKWKFRQSTHREAKVDIRSLPYCVIRLYHHINVNSTITIRDADPTVACVPKSAADFLPVMKFIIIVVLAGQAAATVFRSATRTLADRGSSEQGDSQATGGYTIYVQRLVGLS